MIKTQLKNLQSGVFFKFNLKSPFYYQFSHFEYKQNIKFAFYTISQRSGFYISNNLHYNVYLDSN